MHTMMRRESGNQDLRIVRQRSDIHWDAVWKNLHHAPVLERYKSEWYNVIHDILRTQDRLHKVRLSSTNKCRNCPEPDIIANRIITCGNGREIWHWTKIKVAQIINKTPDHIPDKWPTCPHYILPSPQPNRAVSWMPAILVESRTQSQRELTLQEYIDIFKRSRCKLSTKVTQRRGVETVLQMLDFSP
jgi:hypothetical protein